MQSGIATELSVKLKPSLLGPLTGIFKNLPMLSAGAILYTMMMIAAWLLFPSLTARLHPIASLLSAPLWGLIIWVVARQMRRESSVSPLGFCFLLAALSILLVMGVRFFQTSIAPAFTASILTTIFYAIFYCALIAHFFFLPKLIVSRNEKVRVAIDFFAVLLIVVVFAFFEFNHSLLHGLMLDAKSGYVIALMLLPVLNLILLMLGILLFMLTHSVAQRWFYGFFCIAIVCLLIIQILPNHNLSKAIVSSSELATLLNVFSALFFLLAFNHFSFSEKREHDLSEQSEILDSSRKILFIAIGVGLVSWMYFAWLRLAWQDIVFGFGLVLITTLLILKRQIARAEQFDIFRQRAELDSSARLAVMLEHMSDAVFVIDHQNRVQLVSHGAQRLLGAEAAQIVGRVFGPWLHADDMSAAIALFESVSHKPGAVEQSRLRLRRENDEVLWVDATITNMLQIADVGGVILNLRDISARINLEAQLREEAFNDRLTGLSNRAMLYERTTTALRNCRNAKPAYDIALLLIDLDGFKQINDAMNHAAGDEALRFVGRQLQRCVRDGDTVARVGGDEFAVLLEPLGRASEATYVVERILDTLQNPFCYLEQEFILSASIGVAVADADDQVDDLIRKADVAMYRAKSLGRARYQFFEPELHKLMTTRLALRTQLQDALTHQEFALVYQPIVSIHDRMPIGVEALLRWHRSDGELIAADALVKSAEESGLIMGIGRWVIEQAFFEYRKIRLEIQAELKPRLCLNISPLQLEDPAMVPHLREQMRIHQISPNELVLEIHASALTHIDRLWPCFEQLAKYGMRLVLDDFGSGSVSLESFSKLPLGGVKLDRSFIIDVAKAPQAAQLVQGMISMCNALGLSVAVKGLESLDQMESLLAVGCDEAQGFLFSPAMPMGELIQWLRRHASLKSP